MGDSIRIRSGDLYGRAEMPKLKHAELINGKKYGSEIGFRTDEEALYIGAENGNIRLCGAKDKGEIKTYIDNLISSVNARFEASEGLISTINTQLSGLNESISTIDARLGSLEGDISTIESRLDALEMPTE